MHVGRFLMDRIRRLFGQPVEQNRGVKGASIMDHGGIPHAVGYVLSLLVVITAFNIPWHQNEEGIAWRISSFRDHIVVRPQPEELIEQQDIEGAVVTVIEKPVEEEEPVEEAAEVEEKGTDNEEPLPEVQPIERVAVKPILEFVEQSPTIIGGLSSLYLNIDYPQVARDAGIQGLAVLMFVVEEDGTTSNIEVIRSLHPACDSAAVAAVRKTRFIPGKQEGKEVRVKMRLPIRFKLIGEPPPHLDSLRVESPS